MKELTTRLQEISHLAGKPGHEDRFADEYARLLEELTGAMSMMRQLATAQGSWLYPQLVQRGRFN